MSCVPVERIRAGRVVNDASWDRLYPRWVRGPSRTHWTPVVVARRAAELLVTRPGARVLDVGAGVGKLCVVGALTTEGVFTGIEQRAHLVEIAREVARRCRVGRCRFVHGDMSALDWRQFDALYLYNPFAEHLPGHNQIDQTIDASPERYRKYVHFAQQAFADLPPGARVVTYHGFGGEMPPSWHEASAERFGAGRLELWIKSS
jgi:cyclopropane fatty-acyl-phospholipid synthase-like methyltransferase